MLKNYDGPKLLHHMCSINVSCIIAVDFGQNKSNTVLHLFKVGKSALNQPELLCPTYEAPAALASPVPDPAPSAESSLAALTAEDILNSNTTHPASPPLKGSLLSLDGLPTPSRSSARQALGVTIMRQPGRRGAGDQVLEPLLYLQVMQPSALLSCHHRKQRMELSVFDMALKGVASDYKCLGERDQGRKWP